MQKLLIIILFISGMFANSNSINHFQYEIIISEPLYLSIFILLILATIYTILKKFFKLLIVTLICLIIYVSYLYITGDSKTVDTFNKFIDKGNEIIDQGNETFNDLKNENNK